MVNLGSSFWDLEMLVIGGLMYIFCKIFLLSSLFIPMPRHNITRRFSNHVSRLLSRSHTFAIIVIFNRFENTSKYVDTLTLFSKNLNQRSLTPRWPLTPCLLRSHVWLYPRIIVSKSHDNTSMYVDTVINFAKYHIHTHTYTYILHTTYRMSDHIVSYWTQFRWDKNYYSYPYYTYIQTCTSVEEIWLASQEINFPAPNFDQIILIVSKIGPKKLISYS